jgi:hypothetical protein
MTAVLNDNKFIKQEEEFLADVDVDYVSLHDMVRIFAGFYRHPTEKDYLQALEFIWYLMEKYRSRLECSIGPGDPINKSHEEVISWLKEMWYAGKYKEIDYGVWFDLELEG